MTPIIALPNCIFFSNLLATIQLYKITLYKIPLELPRKNECRVQINNACVYCRLTAKDQDVERLQRELEKEVQQQQVRELGNSYQMQ